MRTPSDADLVFENSLASFKRARKSGDDGSIAGALERLIRTAWPAARYPEAVPMAESYFKRRAPVPTSSNHLSALLAYAHMLATLGDVSKSIEALDRAEASAARAPMEAFANLLSVRAFAVAQLGHEASATELYARAAEVTRRQGNIERMAPCINNYADHARSIGNIELALALHAEVTALVEDARIHWRTQYYLLHHGITCYFAGDLKKARTLLASASAQPPCNRQVSIAQATLAILVGCAVGDDQLAATCDGDSALEDAIKSGEPSKIAQVAAATHRYWILHNAIDKAEALLRRALRLTSSPYYSALLFLEVAKHGDRDMVEHGVKQNFRLNQSSQIRHAYDCFFRARALSLRGESGALHSADAAAQAFDELRWPLHRAAALEAAERYGEARAVFTSCGAFADARRSRSRKGSRGRPRQVAGQLTPRQWEVAKLCVLGLRNHDIADRLGLGVTTVEFHVRNILRELNLTSRYELRDALFDSHQYVP